MSQFTPLIRKTINLEVPVSGNRILQAAKDVVTQSNHEYKLRPREGSDDGTPLVYVKIHSADKREEIVVVPASEGVDFFYKNELEYTHLVVELHSLNDQGGESPDHNGRSDEELKDAIELFAENLRDLLYGE